MSHIGEPESLERKVTATERFFFRSPFAIVTIVARIRGEVTSEVLNRAVQNIQQRHALLQACIREADDHTQWFSSQGVQPIPVEVIPRNSDQAWIEIQAKAMRIPFEFDSRPAIRFILVQSPQVSELIILCHHIICDGLSLAYLARDVMVHLGDPSRAVEVLPTPPAIDLDNLPQDVSQSSIAKYFIRRMNRKWRQDSQYFDHMDYLDLTRAYWDSYEYAFLSVELSAEETDKLVTRCRAGKTTVNSAITAAFCGAQSYVRGAEAYHPRLVVATDLRERLPHSPGEGMGMYAGGVELNFKYNHKQDFWSNARKFNQIIQPKYTNKNMFGNILNWLYLDPTILDAIPFKELGGLVPPSAERYQKLSSFRSKQDIVRKILDQDNLGSLDTTLWGTAVTNLGRLNFPSEYGQLELDRLILQPGGGFPLANVHLVIGAVTCAGKLSLIVEHAVQTLDRDTVEKIKDQAMTFLLEEL